MYLSGALFFGTMALLQLVDIVSLADEDNDVGRRRLMGDILRLARWLNGDSGVVFLLTGVSLVFLFLGIPEIEDCFERNAKK
jgi:hypothetical protein